jgi:hypothetical protein
VKIISTSFSTIRDPSGQNLNDFWFYSMYFVFTLSLAHLVLGYLLPDSDTSHCQHGRSHGRWIFYPWQFFNFIRKPLSFELMGKKKSLLQMEPMEPNVTDKTLVERWQ